MLFVGNLLGLLFDEEQVLQAALLHQEFPDFAPVVSWHTLANSQVHFFHVKLSF